jgi:hypothetical protein
MKDTRRSARRGRLIGRNLRAGLLILVCGAGLVAACGAERAPERKRSPMDVPLGLIARAQASYAKVKDYTCVLVKRERIDGKLTPNNVILMMVRTRPFSVYLRWKDPDLLAGQEVCYVDGQYEGKMRVRPPGVLGAVGFVSIDPDDPRAKQTSRHSVKEAGIGNLIGRLARSWQSERGRGKTKVRVGEYEYDKKRCYRVETTHAENPGKRYLFHRTVVYFDKDTFLPVRLEGYGWPEGKAAKGDLHEVYNFVNIKTNVGLKDSVFDR